LEQALKPAGRYFCLVIYEADEPDPDARIAEFKIENGVQPHDEVVTIIVQYEGR
jgi:hypothetical protein